MQQLTRMSLCQKSVDVRWRVYWLLYDAATTLGYKTSSGGMISEQWTAKDSKGDVASLKLGYRTFLKVLQKSKNLKTQNLSLRTAWRNTGVVEVQLQPFWTSTLDGSEWTTLAPAPFITGQIGQSSHYQSETLDPVCTSWRRAKSLAPSPRRESKCETSSPKRLIYSGYPRNFMIDYV